MNTDKNNTQLPQSSASDSAWISVSDKLPQDGEYVLGYRPYAKELGDEEFTVLKYNGYVRVDHKGNTHGFERCHFVSHWQRLIKP
jgi:hypothetical protein